MTDTYSALLHRLLHINVTGGMKLGLKNCQDLDRLLDFPSQSFPSVHVAGTNGKGSVSTKIAAAYQAMGLKTGLYTSPHISCFRERIRVNGEMISEEHVVLYLSGLFAISEQHHIKATFFELTTMLAFLFFAEQKVDIAILETGLGGRLDATNIAKPILSIITSISLEHTEILGATIEAIAREKGGIIKPKVPVLIGPHVPKFIIEEIATEKSSPCMQVEGIFEDYHAENCAIAAQALEFLNVPQHAVKQGITALPPCRLETFTKEHFERIHFPWPWPMAIILDVAHNPDGLTRLIESIRVRYPHLPLRVILGLSSNKDIQGCLHVIKDHVTGFHLVEGSNSRAVPKEQIYAKLIELGIPYSRITRETSIRMAVQHASGIAGKKQEAVVVCGTFFMMSEARSALGIEEPYDFHDMNEQSFIPKLNSSLNRA